MIRVFFPGDTWVDLPEETPADPYGPPGDDETPMSLEQVRVYEKRESFVLHGGAWLAGRVESWPEEARRLRAERDAAEKRIADLRAWAEQAEATSLDGIHVASDEAARERYRARRCAFARVVAKIDGAMR